MTDTDPLPIDFSELDAAIRRVADAVTYGAAVEGDQSHLAEDASGHLVGSLTEAVIGITAGLFAILICQGIF